MPTKATRQSVSQSVTHSVLLSSVFEESLMGPAGCSPIRPFQVHSLDVKIFARIAAFTLIAVTLDKLIQLYAARMDFVVALILNEATASTTRIS